jgi:DNA (cytosine-5)-methyltransferase 1
MAATFPIVDLFAGPGGLGEGFSSFRDKRGNRPFRIRLSVEKEASAFKTLRLRSFLRQFNDRFPDEYYAFINGNLVEPDWAALFPREWDAACAETMMLELGASEARMILRPRLNKIQKDAPGNAIVIGGPPCQAYSVVGRARNRGIKGYEAREDRRHFLYREYISVLLKLRPAVFVMENVKGMISSAIDGEQVFDLVLGDLRRAGGKRDSYKLFALAPNSDGGMQITEAIDHQSFVVRTEEFGIPQARHRVILLGVRSDIAARLASPKFSGRARGKHCNRRESARHVLDGLPKLRSGLSSSDSDENWAGKVSTYLGQIAGISKSLPEFRDVSARALHLQRKFAEMRAELHRSELCRPDIGAGCSPKLKKWILDSRLHVVPNSFTRSHMADDLARYLFAAIFGQVRGRSPKASEFPKVLSPKHRNWTSGKFADRFRVQIYNQPSSTITSHISKDGHYFIHPDPLQCRSLTVREAARLQTFPDNYLFLGNRTQQYVQVGNAVPPYFAAQIAEVVAGILKIR